MQIASLWSEGLYGLTVDHMHKITVKDTSIYIWFHEDDEDRPWDLSLEYGSPEEAQNSYDDLIDSLRKIRFKKV